MASRSAFGSSASRAAGDAFTATEYPLGVGRCRKQPSNYGAEGLPPYAYNSGTDRELSCLDQPSVRSQNIAPRNSWPSPSTCGTDPPACTSSRRCLRVDEPALLALRRELVNPRHDERGRRVVAFGDLDGPRYLALLSPLADFLGDLLQRRPVLF